MCCYGSTACYVHYNCSKTICPKIKSERLKWIKCGLLTLDRTGFFSCFILKKHTHLFFGQNPVKTATVHTLLQHTQPLHSRVAPLLCLPPLARLFWAWRQVASFYRRILPGFGLFSPLSFSSLGPLCFALSSLLWSLAAFLLPAWTACFCEKSVCGPYMPEALPILLKQEVL